MTSVARRSAIITGAGSGIGLSLAQMLAEEGWDIGAVVRDASTATKVKEAISTVEDKVSVSVFEADLAEPDAVQRAIDEIAEQYPRLTALINNAGVLGDRPMFNSRGVEFHFAVNVIAPYLLMQGLRPLLAASGSAAVVNVSSGAALGAGRLNMKELENPTKYRKLFGSYAQSKLALSLMTEALAPYYESDHIRVVSADPGPNKTKMTASSGMPAFLLPIRNLVFPPPTSGATRVRKALDLALGAGRTGAFYSGSRLRRLPSQPEEIAAALMSRLRLERS